MQPLQNILKKFVKDFGLEGGAALNTLRINWSGIVGRTIASHTSPDSIKKGTLFIIVDTPQWLHHLGFYKKEITEKLKSHGITEIRFRLGKVEPVNYVEEDEDVPELEEADLRFIENTVKDIDDDELKMKFRKLLSHGLTKGKGKK